MKRIVRNHWVEIIVIAFCLLVAGIVAAEVIQGQTAGGVKKTVLVETDGTVNTKVGSGAGSAVGTPIYTAVSKDTSANAQNDAIFVQLSNGTNSNATGYPIYAAVSATTSANAYGNPIYVQNAPQTFLDATAANCADITAASQQYTVTAGQFYSVCAHGNSAYLLGAANPTATTTVTTGYSFIVPEGTCTEKFKPTSAKLAWIGASAAGVICFKAYTSP